MKSVFSYSDYRQYLADFYSEKKRLSEYSYRHFSEKAQLNSPNYLALVIDGKRNLTVSNIHQFVKALELRTDEVEYFETIVHLTQAESEDEVNFYEQRRKKLLTAKPRSILKVDASVRALADWSYTGVLVLAHGLHADIAKNKIRSQLGLSMRETEAAVSALIEQGLLTSKDDGILEMQSSQVTFHDKKSVSRAQVEFLSSQIEQSRKAFQKTYADKSGKFLSHSLTVPKGAIEKIQHKMIGLMEELTNEMDQQVTPESSHLAQVNIQIFHPKKWN